MGGFPQHLNLPVPTPKPVVVQPEPLPLPPVRKRRWSMMVILAVLAVIIALLWYLLG